MMSDGQSTQFIAPIDIRMDRLMSPDPERIHRMIALVERVLDDLKRRHYDQE